jgi:hypothetical protein
MCGSAFGDPFCNGVVESVEVFGVVVKGIAGGGFYSVFFKISESPGFFGFNYNIIAFGNGFGAGNCNVIFVETEPDHGYFIHKHLRSVILSALTVYHNAGAKSS